MACTERKSSSRCRDFDNGIDRFAGGSGTPSKYTQEGGEITLVGEASRDAAVITVSDNGIGISQARLASIFDLFGQEQPPLAIRSGGLGIGLAVVRDLVEAHGGAIVARSPGENRGSKFIVTLPLRRG